MTSIHSENQYSPQKPITSSTYPKPPPLSERTASQKNVQTMRNLHPDFGKTHFPKLPHTSHSNNVHVFEDEVVHAPETHSAVHAGPLIREQHAHVGVNEHVMDGQENQTPSRTSPARGKTSNSPPKHRYPEVDWPELPPLKVVAENLRQSLDVPIMPEASEVIASKPARNSYSSFPSSGTKTPRISLGPTIGRLRSQSTTSTASYGLFPHLPDDFAATIAAATNSAERQRSSSGPQERPRSASSPLAPTDTLFQNIVERTSSNSTEPASDGLTDSASASISRESSDRSASIGMSTGRAAYPTPRKLQRKNVNPQFYNNNGGVAPRPLAPQPRSTSSMTGPKHSAMGRPRINSNWSGFSGRQGAVSPVVEERYSRNGPQSRNGHDSRGQSSSRNRNISRRGSSPHSGMLSPRPGTNNTRRGSGGRVSPRPGYNSQHGSSSRNTSSSRKASSTRSRVPSHGFGPRNGSFARNQFNANQEADYEDWPEEFGEVVPELNFMPGRTLNNESRPSTSSSQRSGRGSLYRFLNDSYTSWAKVYYRNEAALHLEIPPPVAQLGSSTTPPQSRAAIRVPSGGPQVLRVPHGARLPTQQFQPAPMAQNGPWGRMPPRGLSQSTTNSSIPEIFRMPMPRAPPPSRHFRPPQTADSFASIDSRFSESTTLSGVPTIMRAPRGPPFMNGEQLPATPEHHSETAEASNHDAVESPGSAGFPDTVYVPRSRPMPQSSMSVVSMESEQTAESQIMAATPSARDSGEAKKEVSRFSDDDHQSSDQDPVWRDSIYEQDRGIFGVVNRQIFLFCIGFVFPLAWFLGAVLSIPIRPEMRMVGGEEYFDTAPASVDLFDSMAVVRYQKARRWRTTNRIMSILGICIIVIVGATAGVATHR